MRHYRKDSTHFFFFFNDTATTEIYTLSLHDALPISQLAYGTTDPKHPGVAQLYGQGDFLVARSEEHTSELQSRLHLVCRLLLAKKKQYIYASYLSSRTIPRDRT